MDGHVSKTSHRSSIRGASIAHSLRNTLDSMITNDRPGSTMCAPRSRPDALLLVNHYATATERRRLDGRFGKSHLVVVNNDATCRVPDLDTESIRTTTIERTVDGGEQEAVGTCAAGDFTLAFVLCARARDYEPLVARAAECERAGLVVKL